MGISKTYCSYGAGLQSPVATIFRKMIDTTVTPLATGTDFFLQKLPKGFSPCRVFVEVTAVQATTIDVDIMDVDGNSKGILLDDQSLAATGMFVAGDDEIAAAVLADDDCYLTIDAAANLTTAKFTVAVAGWWLKDPADMKASLTDETLQ